MRLSALGDVCNTIPLIHAIQRSQPDIKISWIIGKTEHALVSKLENVDFITIDKTHLLSSKKTIRKWFKNHPADVLLLPQYALRASLIAHSVKAPLIIGYDKQRSRDLQSLFINKRIEFTPHQHVVDAYLDFIKIICNYSDKPDFSIPAKTFGLSKAIEKIIPEDYLVFAPSASNSIRNWPAKSCAKVIRFARQILGIKTVLVGAPNIEEITLCQEIAKEALVPIINLCGKTHIPELVTLINNATLVISPDSGPAHLANATSTPIIGLYACSNPQRSGPYEQTYVINKYPEACEKYLNKTADEVPFGTRIHHKEAMELITVDEVNAMIVNVTGEGVTHND